MTERHYIQANDRTHVSCLHSRRGMGTIEHELKTDTKMLAYPHSVREAKDSSPDNSSDVVEGRVPPTLYIAEY